MYGVKHEYVAQNSDEIPLALGDVVTDIRDVGNGWVVGHNKTTGSTGLCPKDYLQTRVSRKNRMSRFKNRMSTMYVNLTHIPKPESDGSNIPFTVISPEEIETKTKKNIVPPVQTRRQRCIRIVTGILVAVLLGAIIFAAMFFSYGYSHVVAAATAGVVTLVMCIFLIISPHTRCVAAMMSVSVFTGQGRAAFLSLIPGLLLAGPIMNMHSNINEAASSAACIAELLLNQSLALHNQLLEPIAKQQKNLELAAKIIETKTVEIKSSFSSLRSIIRDVNISDISAHGLNASQECARRLSSMQRECAIRSANAVKACKDAVDERNNRDIVPEPGPSPTPQAAHFIFGRRKCKCKSSVCDAADPSKTCDFLNSSKLCEPEEESFRKSIQTVTTSIDNLDDLISFSLNSSSVIDVRGNTSVDPIEKVRELKSTLKRYLGITILVFSILNKVLVVFLIYAFVVACIYLRRYLLKIKFDNIYINDQFKYLDKILRSKDPAKAVLPLKKWERKKYIDTCCPKLSRTEAAKCRMGLSMVLLHITMASIVILMDFALYYVLKVISENGDVDFLVTGGVLLEVQVDGSGPFADIFRAVVEGISVSKEFEDVLNFKQCLPTATAPTLKNFYSIAALHVMAVVFVLMQAYGLRFRHRIIGFFFPEREAERIHYLYRHILLKRTLRDEESSKVNLLADKWAVSGLAIDKETLKC